MPNATFHIHDSLNFFLPRRHKNREIIHPFDWQASIKDMIESLGPPHPEIELITVNGESVDFNYIVQPDDVINVYPDANGAAASKKIPLRPPYPGRPRFVLDTHLGRLTAYLRMMGFDTLYQSVDYPDAEIADVAHDEKRIALSRDVGLLKRSKVIYGYYVRNTDPRKRLTEIVERYDLGRHIEPFQFCMKCNGSLEPVDKDSIRHLISERTQKYYDDFHQCTSCKRVFWQGSHYDKMQTLMNEVLGIE